jgi:hypothetical protein
MEVGRPKGTVIREEGRHTEEVDFVDLFYIWCA